MALTAQQITDVRRYMGYSLSGDQTAYPFRELVYSNVSYLGMSLDYRLEHMSDEEESTVTSFFLANLTLREQEIQDAAANLDTDKAAVWTRNKSEVEDRTALFNQLRRDLCAFLGFPPGNGLTSRMRLMRA
jgi:hypothetical protein